MEISIKSSGERGGFAGRSTRGASLVTTVIALVFAGFAMVYYRVFAIGTPLVLYFTVTEE